MKKGLEKGKKKQVLNLLKSMLMKNYPIEEIRELTKLNYAEIEKLKDEII
ncbi:hypothetical protein KHA80_22730 [Anaerobacillus sp. HL2]|nr:hypothetical protein KHA80_22730 [Anaerobacillus sp. HL2]